MKRVALIIALSLAGCAVPGQPTTYDTLVFSPRVDPASIRDPAKYERDRAECKGMVAYSWIYSFAQEAAQYRNCLTNRGYSVL